MKITQNIMSGPIFFSYFIAVSNCALILNNYFPTCDYKLENEITVVGKDWRIFVNSTEIIFNLCSPVNNGICAKHFACIKNTINESLTFFNGKFEPDGDKVFLGSNDAKCKLVVKWDCSLSKKDEPKVKVKGCEVEITLISPSIACTRPCGAIFNGELLDFSPLKGKYHVQSKNRTYSIFMCGLNPDCGNETTSCDITNLEKPIPLSSGNNMIRYDEETNEIQIHKKTNFPGKVKKLLEISMKCNWTAQKPMLRYLEPLTQGHKFRFEMESSYGCIKLPPMCEFADKFYKYNLTKAYSNVGYIEVKNVTKPRKIFLNICGPLNLTQTDNICMRSSSQVCEINENEYFNKGSIYTKPAISNKDVSMSLITGSKCAYDPSKTYKTTINFYCSRSDEYPTFLREENCELFLSWNTSAACPQLNITSCREVHKETHTCSFNQQLLNGINSYNLDELNNSAGYLLRDKNIEYRLNVCGPVIDPDAPCIKNANVLAKYLDEPDIRKKIVSYGTSQKIDVQDKYLVMETSGDFCEGIHFYKSNIFFECSDKESEISLKSATVCTLEFLWKTKHACPKKTEVVKKCVFNYPFNDQYLLDFTALKQTSLKATVSKTQYLFDLCGNSESECPPESCIYVPVNKNVLTYGNKTYLEFNINQKCDSKNMFNKTVFELVCSEMKNNDHFTTNNKIQGCTLLFYLNTHRACFKKDVIIPLEHDGDKDYVSYNISIPKQSKEDKTHIIARELKSLTNCTVKNQNTGYEFNISLLNINISSSKCPDIAFNLEKQMVSLVYNLPDKCIKDNGDRSPLDFRILLKCNKLGKLHNSTMNGSCAQNRTIEFPEACKLIESILDIKTSNAGMIAGIVVSAVVGLILVMLILWVYIRRRKRSSYGSLSMSYEKDADM